MTRFLNSECAIRTIESPHVAACAGFSKFYTRMRNGLSQKAQTGSPVQFAYFFQSLSLMH